MLPDRATAAPRVGAILGAVSKLHQTAEDIWILPLGGADVTRVCRMADTGFVLELASAGDDVTLRLSCSFSITQADGRRGDLTAENYAAVGPLLGLAGATVRQATFTPAGKLTILFQDGRIVRAENDPDYESWEVAGPGNILVVAMPGVGEEPAIWS